MRLSKRRFESILDVLADADDVLVTFDDGTVSQMEIGLPALLDRGLSAHFYVVAGRLGQDGFMSTTDIRLLREHGMTIGSHGMHHCSWRAVDDDELRTETAGAKEVLEEALGETVSYAACPFGAYDRRVLKALREAGLTRVYTSDGGPARSSAWVQARISLHADDSEETVRFILSRVRNSSRRVLQRLKQTVKGWR